MRLDAVSIGKSTDSAERLVRWRARMHGTNYRGQSAWTVIDPDGESAIQNCRNARGKVDV